MNPSRAFALAGTSVVFCSLALGADEVLKTGTGFAVNTQGHLVTNAHVISGCARVTVKLNAEELAAQTIAVDAGNDIAVMKVERKFESVPPLRVARGVQLGESVAAFGYPLQGVLSSSLNMTIGNVSSLLGLSEDTRSFQFTAPIQPGNSGGPIVDSAGNVVGIATSKLSPLWAVRNRGDLPQNVNFAIRISIVRDFLESRGISFEAAALSSNRPTTELASAIGGATALVQCLGSQSSDQSTPNASAVETPKRRGVLVAGYGQPAEFFKSAYIEAQNTLAVLGVRVANQRAEFGSVSDDSVTVPQLLQVVKRFGSDSLLYMTTERSGMNIRRVRLKCFDPDGKLLWEEEASNSRQLFGNEESAVRYALKEMKKKLEPHAGKPGLPLR